MSESNRQTNISPSSPPVLFLVFNRPDVTAKVFEAIRQARPARLYVAADAPRKHKAGEEEKCALVREIATAVDWDCELQTLFREENLGCARAVSGAIDWFFEVESEGVILEDDCLPDPSFFRYCKELLRFYRDDTRVMHISGYNFLPEPEARPTSYYFSRYPGIWGWATWRRAWEKFDYGLKSLPGFCADESLDYGYHSRREKRERIRVFRMASEGIVSSWGYRWDFALRTNGGLCVRPAVNLITNIGFGEEATHTTGSNKALENNLYREMPFPLVHPELMLPNKVKDIELFKKVIAKPSRWQLAKLKALKILKGRA